MKLYQTEQECGDGQNDWVGAVYSLNLMRHYLNNGASAYMYWNISLKNGGISRWGWAQNSLVVVDPGKNIVVVLANEEDSDRQVTVEAEGRKYTPVLKAGSFNTLYIR